MTRPISSFPGAKNLHGRKLQSMGKWLPTKIDSLNIYQKTIIKEVTNTVEKLGVGVMGGYGVTKEGLSPFYWIGLFIIKFYFNNEETWEIWTFNHFQAVGQSWALTAYFAPCQGVIYVAIGAVLLGFFDRNNCCISRKKGIKYSKLWKTLFALFCHDVYHASLFNRQRIWDNRVA